jgi:hypothetical protein
MAVASRPSKEKSKQNGTPKWLPAVVPLPFVAIIIILLFVAPNEPLPIFFLGFFALAATMMAFVFGNLAESNKNDEKKTTPAPKGKLTIEEQRLVGYLSLYPKISLEALSKKVGKPALYLENMILDLKMRDVIKGHIDPGTNEFISGMVDRTTETVIDRNIHRPDAYFCPYCGAKMASVPVKGTSTKCDSCGNLVVV